VSVTSVTAMLSANCRSLSVCLATAVNLDSLGACLALDVTTPVVLAVAVMAYNHRLHRITTTTAHRLTAFRTGRVFFTHPVYIYMHITSYTCVSSFVAYLSPLCLEWYNGVINSLQRSETIPAITRLTPSAPLRACAQSSAHY